MKESDLKALVREMEAIRAGPVRSAEFDKKMKKAMKKLGEKWRKDEEECEESKRRALAHYLRIKDIPFMARNV